MAKQVKCPKCGTAQPLSNNCVQCNLDFRAYARHLKQKRAAAAAAAGQAPPARSASPTTHKRKIVKCPKCATQQPLGDKCVSCGMDFKAHIEKLRARKTAAAQAGQGGGVAVSSDPSLPGGVTFGPGGLRSIGKLFEDSWLIYRERFVTLFFLNLFIPIFMLVPLVIFGLLGLTGAVFGPDMAAVGVMLGALIGFLIGFPLMVIPMAGLVAAIHDQSLGLKAALKVGRAKMGSYLWVLGLVGLIVPAGFFLLFIPGMIFVIWFMFAKYIVVLEDQRGMATLLKSKEYVRGHFWPLFGRLLLIGVISSIVGSTGIGSLLFQPFAFVMTYIMYRDLREDKGQDIAYPASGSRWILLTILVYVLIVAMMVGAVIMSDGKFSDLDLDQFKQKDGSTQSSGQSTSGIDLNSEARITTSNNVYAQGENITIEYFGMSGSDSDWITLVQAGHSETSYGQWFYTHGTRQGSYTFSGVDSGDYEIRAYFDYNGGGGYTVRARKSITVTDGPGGAGGANSSGAAGEFVANEDSSLLLDDTHYAPMTTATVHYMAPAGLPDNAWVGVIPSHVPHGSESVNDGHDLSYKYLGGSTSGSMTFTVPSKPGEYDFRMHDTDSGGKELTYISFTVTGDPAR